MKHQKHTKLEKPFAGDFGRQEWAIIGTTCAHIQSLVQDISARLPDFKIAYLDASHAGEQDSSDLYLSYTRHHRVHEFRTREDLNKWQIRPYFNQAGMLLLNGNHFQGQRQIVVIDSVKENSLSKKLDRLTDVGLVLLKDREKIYDFLSEKVGNVPVLDYGDLEGIVDFLRKQYQEPELYGLVLMGGKSRRMGRDKGLIAYHGKPQREYVAELLSTFTQKTFFSGRGDQAGEVTSGFEFIPDTFLGLGPYGGILSAFQRHPDKAWLVMAVDLPKMDQQGLQELVDGRNSRKLATAFLNEQSRFPEPLVTIWEPAGYAVLLNFLAQGYSCPRKVLINSDIELLEISAPEKLMNVNTPEDFGQV